MLIGEVARSTGLTASAIRFYEQHGIVPRAQRNAEGYRRYSEKDVELLRFVRRLRALNIPLDDVREVVTLRSGGLSPCRPMRDAITRGVSRIDREIRELARVRDQLTNLQIAADGMEDHWPDHCVCSLVDSDRPEHATGSAVRITLQYFEGCPNWEVTDRRLAALGVPVTYQRIETLSEALQQCFRGSPTVLVNGADPFEEPGAPIGLTCRVYKGPSGPSGAPSIDDLAEAIYTARKEALRRPTTSQFR